MNKKMLFKTRVFLVFALCIFMVLSIVVFFGYFQNELQPQNIPVIRSQKHPRKVPSKAVSLKKENLVSVATVVSMRINAKIKQINFTAYQSKEYLKVLQQHLNDLRPVQKLGASPWKIAGSWVRVREVLPSKTPYLGTVLEYMRKTRIIKADVGHKGTQLKILLTLQGGQNVVFKPKMFNRDQVITGLPYSGADRHNGEIVAFHLSRLLGLRRTPLATGRRLNLKTEVLPVSTQALAETFLTKGNNTCFYGRCYYCSPENAACGEREFMEGTVILWLPKQFPLKLYRSPWQRTYRQGLPAKWEVDPKYCDKVQKNIVYREGKRLLDLVDTSVFDYLIGNADRHHYEVFAEYKDGMVLLLDNGKSFGNPYWDELTILAPLYQCCRIRRSTYDHLRMFVGVLGHSVDKVTSFDPLYPVVGQPHLEAMDRRLKTIIATVQVCIDEKGANSVFAPS